MISASIKQTIQSSASALKISKTLPGLNSRNILGYLKKKQQRRLNHASAGLHLKTPFRVINLIPLDLEAGISLCCLKCVHLLIQRGPLIPLVLTYLKPTLAPLHLTSLRLIPTEGTGQMLAGLEILLRSYKVPIKLIKEANTRTAICDLRRSLSKYIELTFLGVLLIVRFGLCVVIVGSVLC